jgi:heptosyltransferase-2
MITDQELPGPVSGVQAILVVKLADLGDALLSTPALRALRESYPQARLDVLTTPVGRQVYEHAGLTDEIIVFEKQTYDTLHRAVFRPAAPLALRRDLRERSYDMTVLLHSLTTSYGALKHAALTLSTGARLRVGLRRPGSWRGWFLTHWATDVGFDQRHVLLSGLAVARAAGASPAGTHLSFDPGPEARAESQQLMAALAPRVGSMTERGSEGVAAGGRPDVGHARVGRTENAVGARSMRSPVVAIHPGSGAYSPARRWSPQSFAAVARGLAADGARIVVLGRAEDDTSAVAECCDRDVLDLTERTSLPVLAAVLEQVDMLVCNDSGVMHVATAMGTPVVAVFGPTSQAAWGPWWPGAVADDADRPGASPHRVVSLSLSCRPCLYVGYDLGTRMGCPTRDCMAWLPPEAVLQAAREVMISL